MCFDFFESILRHSKGQTAGQPFTLMPWQKNVLGNLFGRVSGDTRQYRVGYIELGCAPGPQRLGGTTQTAAKETR